MVIEKTVSKYKRGKSFGYRINISKTDNLTKDERIIILKVSEYKILNNSITNFEKNINDLNNELEKVNDELLAYEKIKNELEDSKKEINRLNKETKKLMEGNTDLLNKLAKYKSLEESNENLQEKLNGLRNIKTKNQELEKTIVKQDLKLMEYETNNENIGQINKIYKETLEKITKQQYETIEKLNQQFHNQTKQNNNEFNKKLERYIAVNLRLNEALKQILELGFIDLIMNKHKKIAKNQIKKLNHNKKVYELAFDNSND